MFSAGIEKYHDHDDIIFFKDMGLTLYYMYMIHINFLKISGVPTGHVIFIISMKFFNEITLLDTTWLIKGMKPVYHVYHHDHVYVHL